MRLEGASPTVCRWRDVRGEILEKKTAHAPVKEVLHRINSVIVRYPDTRAEVHVQGGITDRGRPWRVGVLASECASDCAAQNVRQGAGKWIMAHIYSGS